MRCVLVLENDPNGSAHVPMFATNNARIVMLKTLNKHINAFMGVPECARIGFSIKFVSIPMFSLTVPLLDRGKSTLGDVLDIVDRADPSKKKVPVYRIAVRILPKDEPKDGDAVGISLLGKLRRAELRPPTHNSPDGEDARYLRTEQDFVRFFDSKSQDIEKWEAAVEFISRLAKSTIPLEFSCAAKKDTEEDHDDGFIAALRKEEGLREKNAPVINEVHTLLSPELEVLGMTWGDVAKHFKSRNAEEPADLREALDALTEDASGRIKRSV